MNEEWLKDQYINKKKSVKQIVKDYNLTMGAIYYWLKKFGIQIHTQSEANHLSQKNSCNLSRKAREWIDGELLGDGCLKSYSKYSAQFKYSSKHEEYINYVSETLKSFGIKRTGKIYKYHVFAYSSLFYGELLPIYKRWYPKGKKIVPKDIELTPLTCRQWYIGDGSLQIYKGISTIILYTCGFLCSDVRWLKQKLENLKFKCWYLKSNNSIKLSAKITKDFLDYIGKCPVDCYQYKWMI